MTHPDFSERPVATRAIDGTFLWRILPWATINDE